MMAESKRKCNSLSPLEFHQASFRKLLTVLAEHMEQEEVVKCCFIYQVPRERSSSALAALEYLLAVGVLSHSNIEPLVELLKDINRHDLISDRVEPFIKQRNEEQESAESKATGVQAGLESGYDSITSGVSLRSTLSTSESVSSTEPLTLQSLSTAEKRQLLYKLRFDPGLQMEFQSLRLSSSLSVDDLTTSHMTSSVSSPEIRLEDSRSTQFRLGSSLTCPDFSNSPPQPQHSQLCPKPSPQTSRPETSQSRPEQRPKSLVTDPPGFLIRQLSDDDGDGFYSVSRGGEGEKSDTAVSSLPLNPPATPNRLKKRMEWSINRVELGRKIVQHSNSPFIKGNYSLSTEGLGRWWSVRDPVSLVFKVYPCGLGEDENESLTMEVLVDCRCQYLLAVAKLSLQITLSMDNGKKFISTRTWRKILKKFVIHDFLPHEVITRNYSKTLDFTFLSFIAYD